MFCSHLLFLSFIVHSVPSIIIVGRKHVPQFDTTDEVVMAVEVPVAVDLNKPRATTGATCHVAGYGDHVTGPMLPQGAAGTRAGLPGLAIKRIASRIAVGIKGLVDGLIIGQPAPPTASVKAP